LKIADLFVNISAKGADKTIGALGEIRKGFSSITSTSLETKAAILGVMYGLERLMSQSAQAGTNLTQFSNLTGLSQDKLQRWQYLALQAGESADTMAGDVNNLQQAMAKMYLGQGAPAGMNAVANTLKQNFDPKRYRDTFYMMDKLREYIQKTKDTPDIARNVVKSFGLSDQTYQTMVSQTGNLSDIAQSRLYSANQIKRLNDVNIGFANIKDKFEHGFGKINAQFGPQMVKDLAKVSDAVLKIVSAFAMLADKLRILQGFTRVFDGWAIALGGIADVTKTVASGKAASLVPDMTTMRIFAQSLVGTGPAASTSKTTNVTNNVKVEARITGVKDADDVAKHLNKHINDAYRNIPKGGH